ncbi:DUF4396 domain-containing protein [Allorhizobium sp. BGMRC 0089]|uniref:DUF4396 domain-containing protein n=1 Tax=Allorhizobium sonneratiae TaxID=2934936 RepID=UPI002033AA1B|nr:DUF4396 domain-containing protein [Allorhizobium sonneratiae]MCM2294065.1 DUF4396 domain-containing protein [Allorhizobium sonneratiae]
MIPSWYHWLSILCLLLGGVSAIGLAIDVMRHPLPMKIMNIVWPVTALFGSLAVIWLYLADARKASGGAGEAGMHHQHGSDTGHHAMQHDHIESGHMHHGHMHGGKKPPMPVMVAKGALHCGSGCMIGDIVAEWLAFLLPSLALVFGWHSLFGEKIFAVWVFDFVLAFLLGIAFQYFAIVPMRKLSPGQGLVAAFKADTLSLISWQIGMYAVMALFQFLIYPAAFGHRVEVNTPEFWFAMQLAMIAGFATSYPMNWWLISQGIKEKM